MGTGGRVKPLLDLAMLRRLEVACLVFAAVAAAAHLFGLLLVVGAAVVTFWAVSATLLAASVMLRLASWRVSRSTDAPPPTESFKLVRGVSAFVVGLTCVSGAFIDLGASYLVLDPAGPDGCRAVVREHSFLMSGSGSVYAVRFGGIGLSASSWTTDDGYEPVAGGSYDLDWDGSAGVLELFAGVDPVWPAIHTIPCS